MSNQHQLRGKGLAVKVEKSQLTEPGIYLFLKTLMRDVNTEIQTEAMKQKMTPSQITTSYHNDDILDPPQTVTH